MSCSGLRFFFWSLSSVPTLMAMIWEQSEGTRELRSARRVESRSRTPDHHLGRTSGAASGSWAIGLPHSEQKLRVTFLPESPLLVYSLTGPEILTALLWNTATRL